jgi:aldehyde dehydrogenase (NAD+)
MSAVTTIASASGSAPLDLASIPDRVAQLRAGFDSGRTRPLAWRIEQLERLRAMLVENADAVTRALHADLRKPETEAWATDVSLVLSEIALAKKSLRKWTKPEAIRTPMKLQPAKSWIVREPLGLVLIIAPWNYPVQLALAPLVAAIAAGNAAVVKPSEVTPHVSSLLATLIPNYLDRECIACVEGGVEETSALLAERWDHVFYTGNGRVGRIVMQAAAKHLTPVTLELGGKSPCIVDADCDLDVAARRIVWGKFINCGQTCIAPDYVLVHESRHDELLEKLVANLRAFYGEEPQRSADLGRIVNEAHVDRLAKLLESGKAVIGGTVDRADRWIAPTILRDVAPDSPVMQEEIFGPILPVLAIRDVDEAIAFVNRGEKPLALYVFTERPAVEEAVITRTSSGGVCVNAVLWHIGNENLPFGGVGESGMGAYHGRHGFEVLSHHRAVLKKSVKVDPSIAYPPFTKLKKALIKRFA